MTKQSSLCQKKMIKEGILEYQERIKKKKTRKSKNMSKDNVFSFSSCAL
jgi:hypothetical protein